MSLKWAPPPPPMRNYTAYSRTQYLIRELREQLRHEVRVSVAGSFQWHQAKQRLEQLSQWPGLPS